MANILSKIPLFLINIYQKFISPLLGGGCRFYPTCSEYAKWNFEKRGFFVALYYTIFRVLRCSPLTKGGIDYPIVAIPKKLTEKKIKPKFFIIPKDKNSAFLIKVKFDII
jgi:putative membrane protein insertion efficiency factor